MTVLHDYAAGVTQPTLTGGTARYDEVIAPDGSLRPTWRPLAERILALTEPDLRRVARHIERFLANDGVVYNRGGRRRRWQLDPLPIVIGAAEWAPLAAGLAQRTELLNALLVDLYGEQRVLSSGVLPSPAVYAHRGFLRVAARASSRDPRPLLMAAADLGRTATGEWQVLSDRTQAPSGIGYAMENRRVISRVMPDVYRDAGLHRVAPYFQALRSSLLEAAPPHVPNPRVVVLSPGSHSETAYDQSFIASSLGFPLVQGADLTVRDGVVWMRALGRMERVDVILRRVDASWSDPLELRGESQLGVAGLVEAARRGSVRVVNGLGAGVLENPAFAPYLDRLCEMLLDEPLRLPSIRTWWCGDDASRSHVLAHADDLVVRQIDRPGQPLELPREELRARVEAEPHRYVGQEVPVLSQMPTLLPRSGDVAPRGMVLRTFTIAYGSGYRPLQGGLATMLEGDRAGASKDVWVIKDSPDAADQGLTEVVPMSNVRAPAATVPRVLEDMFWVGRYVERAEDMLRLVLQAHSMADDYRGRPHSSGGQTLAVLLAALERLSPSPEPAQPDDVFRGVLLEPFRPGSVAQAVAAMRDASQGVRDQLSGDVWRSYGAIDRAADALVGWPHGHQIGESASGMLTAVLAFGGVSANMMRDPGWHLLGAGRDVERALQLCHLMRATLTVRRGIDVDRDVSNAVLAAAESAVTHRRRYRGYVRTGNVLELLLVDVENPRSLAFCLASLREHLAAMPDSTGSSRPQRMLDDLVEELERVDIATLAAISGEDRPNLDRFLVSFTGQLERFAEAVAEHHFAPAPAQRSFGFPVALPPEGAA